MKTKNFARKFENWLESGWDWVIGLSVALEWVFVIVIIFQALGLPI